MKKIPTVFVREHRYVTREVTPGCEWVLAGEGIATRKFDGTCCLVRGQRLYKRFDAKHGKKPPDDFEPAQEPDPVTGHWPGWVPVGDGPEDRWHREAFELTLACVGVPDGTYELIGPKINGNPENRGEHQLVPHGKLVFRDFPRDFDGMRNWFAAVQFTASDTERLSILEGVVFHHPDGRMAKIKEMDFLYTAADSNVAMANPQFAKINAVFNELWSGAKERPGYHKGDWLALDALLLSAYAAGMERK